MAEHAEECRAELERVLAAPEFASSRQLQEFLRYTSERAFEGATRVEQAEIAAAILGRRSGFNPLEDASVRKLATMARQRLEQYYARAGASGGVYITLPVRSYIPHFGPPPHVAESPEPLLPSPVRARRRPWIWIAAGALALAAAAAVAFRRPATRSNGGVIEMITVRGDIANSGADIPSTAVQLGPRLGEVDEVSAELAFTAAQEAQQAGILVWQDEDNYVRLGRRFFGRNQIDFAVEVAGRTASQSHFDPEGQTGRPLHLAIRRTGNLYRGFTSRDGVRWEPAGQPVSPPVPFTAPRAAVYAFHGRRQAPAARAVFRNLSTGLTFDGEDPGYPAALTAHGWHLGTTCGPHILTDLDPPALRFSATGRTEDCHSGLVRPIAGRDFEIRTRVDFYAIPGASAGLQVNGAKNTVRLVRYVLNTPAVALIHDARTLVGLPDLNGSPALILRLTARDGWLEGSFSADGEHFRALETRIALDQLGGGLRAGLRYSVNSQTATLPPPARFYWYRQAVLDLTPFRPRR